MASPILVFVFASKALVALYIYYQCLLHPLAHYPGPFIAKLTNIWRLYFFFRGSIHIVDHELFKTYNSPVIRAGPNRLIFSSAAAWRVTHGYSERFERGDMFILSRFTDTTESSVFTAKTHQEHRAKRKALISAAMTPRAFASYEPHLARNCYKWLSIVERELAERGPDFDPSKSLKALGFDAFFEMLTGSPIGCLNDGLWKTEAFAEAIKQKERTSRDSFGFGLVPWIAKFIVNIMGFITKPYFYRECYNLVTGKPLRRTMLFWHPLNYTQQVLLPAARLAGNIVSQVQPSILSLLVSTPSFTNDQIIADIRAQHFGGTGTTATALSFLLYDLASQPTWQARIAGELAALPDNTYASFSAHCPVFTAFLRESFRVHPAIPGVFERTIEMSRGQGPDIPGCAQLIPPGTVVGSVIYSVNRDVDVFGDDVNSFRPERWLNAHPEQLRRMKESWAGFGRGRRSCLGETGAMMVIQKCVEGLLGRWIIELPENDTLVSHTWFETSISKLPLRFTPRLAE